MVNFVNIILSYLVLMAIILVVAGAAIAIGIHLARKKNAKAQAGDAADPDRKA